jgi:hypothetical protein
MILGGNQHRTPAIVAGVPKPLGAPSAPSVTPQVPSTFGVTFSRASDFVRVARYLLTRCPKCSGLRWGEGGHHAPHFDAQKRLVDCRGVEVAT